MAILDLSTERSDGTVRLILTGELDISTSPRVEEELASIEAEAPAVILLDLRGVQPGAAAQQRGEVGGAEDPFGSVGLGQAVRVEDQRVAGRERDRLVAELGIVHHPEERSGPPHRIHPAVAVEQQRQRVPTAGE